MRKVIPKKKGAPGIPDVECFYENYSLILEVTLKTDHNQWQDETTSIFEHLEEFIERSGTKENFCLFIAPALHSRAARNRFQPATNKNGLLLQEPGTRAANTLLLISTISTCTHCSYRVWNTAIWPTND